MIDYKKVYEEWLNNEFFDENTRKDLLSIKDNEEEIKDRFYKVLELTNLETSEKKLELEKELISKAISMIMKN